MPTPPLPDAIASTRVSGASEIVFSGRPPRSRDDSAAFSSALITSKWSSTEVDALDAAHEPLHLILERGAHRAAGDGQRDRDLDAAVVVNHDVAHHVELGDGLVQLGVDDRLERRQDRIAGRQHRHPSLPAAYVVARGNPGGFRGHAGAVTRCPRRSDDEG